MRVQQQCAVEIYLSGAGAAMLLNKSQSFTQFLSIYSISPTWTAANDCFISIVTAAKQPPVQLLIPAFAKPHLDLDSFMEDCITNI